MPGGGRRGSTGPAKRRSARAERKDDGQAARARSEGSGRAGPARRRRRAARGAAGARTGRGALSVVPALHARRSARTPASLQRVGCEAVEGLRRERHDAPVREQVAQRSISSAKRSGRRSEMRRMSEEAESIRGVSSRRSARTDVRARIGSPVPRTTQRPSEKSVRLTPSTSAARSCGERRTRPSRARRRSRASKSGRSRAAGRHLHRLAAAQLHDLRSALPFQRREPPPRADRAAARTRAPSKRRRGRRPPSTTTIIRMPERRGTRLRRRRGGAPRSSRSPPPAAAGVGTIPAVSHVGPEPAGGSASR